jgi:hypothetical protein
MSVGLLPRALLTTWIAAACAGSPVDDPRYRTGPGALPDPPDLRGTITARAGELIRVEAESGSSEAVVRVTPLTWLTDARGDQLTLDALLVGQHVAVWFTGSVAEAYPVQGEGLRIIVE